jgi:hypothetical protein
MAKKKNDPVKPKKKKGTKKRTKQGTKPKIKCDKIMPEATDTIRMDNGDVYEKNPDLDPLYDSEKMFDALHGKNPMQEAIEGAGITTVYLAKKLKSELEATHQKVHFEKGAVIGAKEDGKDDTVTIREAGDFKYSKKMVDWGTRQKARIDAHKLLGHYPEESLQLDVTDKTIQFLDQISGKDRNKLPSEEEDD